jgi:hypothetical protein
MYSRPTLDSRQPPQRKNGRTPLFSPREGKVVRVALI